MNSFVTLAIVLSLAVARNPTPYELVGGMNPDYGSFIPSTPIVKKDESGQGYIDNYPHCGVYESQCLSGLLISKDYAWTFSGYEESVPSFLQLNVTYYMNRYCNSTRQLLHLSYTWFVTSITNNWQDWEVTGNNLFIKVLSDDVMNSLNCDKGVLVKKEIMSVQQLHCADVGSNGIMYSYNRHFNKSRILHLRFNTDVLITYSDDIVESLGVLKLLDVASTGTVLDSNVEYTRTQDFGCCKEDKVPVVVIVLICVAAVVVIGAVVAIIVVKSKKTKTLPKKTTVLCVC
ncbi:hypothetical protein BLSTO_02384 [Blastocystis sp. subtype 1]